jgi:ABC-type antimicrobial peptide transport system permease subunit
MVRANRIVNFSRGRLVPVSCLSELMFTLNSLHIPDAPVLAIASQFKLIYSLKVSEATGSIANNAPSKKVVVLRIVSILGTFGIRYDESSILVSDISSLIPTTLHYCYIRAYWLPKRFVNPLQSSTVCKLDKN